MHDRSSVAERESRLFAWRRAVRDSALPSTVKLVLWTLSSHMDGDGGSCFPSLDQLAREASLGKATVSRALTRARKDGWVDWHSGGGRRPGGNGNANEYQLAFPAQATTVSERERSQSENVLAGSKERSQSETPGRHSRATSSTTGALAREGATTDARDATDGGSHVRDDRLSTIVDRLELRDGRPLARAQRDRLAQAFAEDPDGVDALVARLIPKATKTAAGLVLSAIARDEHRGERRADMRPFACRECGLRHRTAQALADHEYNVHHLEPLPAAA